MTNHFYFIYRPEAGKKLWEKESPNIDWLRKSRKIQKKLCIFITKRNIKCWREIHLFVLWWWIRNEVMVNIVWKICSELLKIILGTYFGLCFNRIQNINVNWKHALFLEKNWTKAVKYSANTHSHEFPIQRLVPRNNKETTWDERTWDIINHIPFFSSENATFFYENSLFTLWLFNHIMKNT